MSVRASIVSVSLACFLLGGPPASAEEGGTPSWVGVSKCKSCHNKKDKGAQYSVWNDGPHAGAFKSLASPEALAIAEELGLEVPPQESARCLECHVTGHGEPEELTGKLKAKRGVGCESCHGAGGDYAGKDVMGAIFSGDVMPETVGLVFPDETACLRCHNERSPTFAGFDFDAAVELIAHPYPPALEDKRGGETGEALDERSFEDERR